MAYIRRSIESLFLNRSRTSKSNALTGARQVGKTTLTTNLVPSIKRTNMKNPALLIAAKEDPQLFLEGF